MTHHIIKTPFSNGEQLQLPQMWCNRSPAYRVWAFQDASAALLSLRHNGGVKPCVNCLKAIRNTIDKEVGMKGIWVKEGDEYLYMVNGDYTVISILPPDLDDMDDDFQLTIGYPSNIKEQYFLSGDWRRVKKEASEIADRYLSENEMPTLDN